LVKAAEGVEVIFNFTLIKYNPLIMEAALACQAHYVDTACNLNFLNQWITGDTPQYHQEFVDIGKTALVGIGFSPGIANVLTRYACDRMDQVESIMIRVGRGYGDTPEEVVSEWKPGWSPEILLEDYADPPMVLKDGEYLELPIFSNPEAYTFPSPVGEILISSHCHEEPYLMPRYYLDKGLKEVDFKYPVDKLAGAFVKMGFADDGPIDVKGVKVSPVDVLMKLVKRPGNSFLLWISPWTVRSQEKRYPRASVINLPMGRIRNYSSSCSTPMGPPVCMWLYLPWWGRKCVCMEKLKVGWSLRIAWSLSSSLKAWQSGVCPLPLKRRW
jgi:saccharopine dehydrogenase-like NADP-dependent oxidoreductase